MILTNILFGAIIGLANIIPGVSGGTMAVILNIYDKLLDSISHFSKNVKENIKFLGGILIGAGCAIILFSRGITYLLDNHYLITNFFFIGIILGSIPMVKNRAIKDSFKPIHLIPCVITLAIMLVTVFVSPESQETVLRTLSFPIAIKLFAISMVAAICMIIPGISGSFVMLLFGVYETITTAISEMNILILIPIGLGVLLGILVASKLIGNLIAKYPQATYFAILGFMIGSVPAILGKIHDRNLTNSVPTMLIAVGVLFIGISVSYLFSSEWFQRKVKNIHKKT